MVLNDSIGVRYNVNPTLGQVILSLKKDDPFTRFVTYTITVSSDHPKVPIVSLFHTKPSIRVW